MSSDHDTSFSRADAEISRTTAGDAASEKTQVLLLESDPAFRDVIRQCLADSGYGVVTVENSKDGLKEVLARAFALVLYDPMLPGLPCNLFYKAANRVDRELCERFVFMTGGDSDDPTTDFIIEIDGLVLRKPFEVGSLLDLIAFVQARGTFDRVAKPSLDEPVPSGVQRSSVDFPAGGIPRSQESPSGERAAQVIAPTQPVSTVPLNQTRVPDAASPQTPIHSGSTGKKGIADRFSATEARKTVQRSAVRGSFPIGIIFLCLALAMGWAGSVWALRKQYGETEAVARILEAGIESAAARCNDAVYRERALDALLAADRRRTEVHHFSEWLPGLLHVMNTSGSSIEISEVYALDEEPANSSPGLRLRGITSGLDPRMATDRFREALEQQLKQRTGSATTARIEKLDEVKTGQETDGRVAFEIRIHLKVIADPIPKSKGGA